MVDKVMVSRERYQSAATAKSEMFPTSCSRSSGGGVDTEDPSNVKALRLQLQREQGGGIVRVYHPADQRQARALTVEHYSKNHRHFTAAASAMDD